MLSLNPDVVQVRSLTSQRSKPQFGCRLLAVMSPSQYEGQDTFIKELLTDGGNSLLRQSPVTNDKGSLSQSTLKAKPGFDKHAIISNGPPWQLSWGLATLAGWPRQAIKLPNPAAIDPSFPLASDLLAKQKPLGLIGHLRQSYSIDLSDKTPDSIHPFRINDWYLAQVGSVAPNLLDIMSKRLKEAAQHDPEVVLPKGTTDTEVVACYMALKLREQTRDDNSEQISPQRLEAIFKNLMRELTFTPKTPSDEDFQQSMQNGFQGSIRNMGNKFIFANRRQMLFSQLGLNASKKYYLGTHQLVNGQKDYVISAFPMTPRLRKDEALSWQLIPDDMMLNLKRVRNPEGDFKIQIEQTDLPKRPNGLVEFEEDMARCRAVINSFLNAASPLSQPVPKT